MIQLQPIGVVRNGIDDYHREMRWEGVESVIEIDEAWRDALDGLEEFSHLWIIFFLDRIPALESLRVRPMHRDDMPLVGRLATRTPSRPCPIGLTPVELIKVEGTRLHVRGLDALEGTPVLDIKPYLERGDAITHTRVGAWVRQYWGVQDGDKP